MNYVDLIKKAANCENFIETKSYYFENHICQKNGENNKVALNYKISNDLTDDIITFGICEGCKTLFYHKDFESKTF